METSEILIDAFGRIEGLVHRVVSRATDEQMTYRPDGDANPIAWLVWHLTRVMDDHVSEIAGSEQDWIVGGWADRCALPFDLSETGYGHRRDQVGRVEVPGDILLGYHDAVQQSSVRYVGGIEATELDRIIDRSWDPPVSVGVRLVSVIGDCMQHIGQAAYVLGMAQRR